MKATTVRPVSRSRSPSRSIEVYALPAWGSWVLADIGGPDIRTREELGLFLAALPSNWRLFFELLAHTGLRISEAVGLTWQHVELGERPRILVREQLYRGERKRLKSKDSRREIPLSPGMTRRLLEHRRDSYRGDTRPVFATATGEPLHPSNVNSRVLRPALRASGLAVQRDDETWDYRGIAFHAFRHTCASLLFEEGRNVKQVQEWLGHADPGFTLRTYVHLMDDGVGGAEFSTQPSSHPVCGKESGRPSSPGRRLRWWLSPVRVIWTGGFPFGQASLFSTWPLGRNPHVP